jgi:DNA ligase-associated metallophosphoesterase
MTIRVADETMALTPRGAVFWPSESALFVADLHLGKEASFRAHGIPLPEGSTAATLANLAHDLAETGAKRLVVLGDLWHDRHGLAPLTAERLREWLAPRCLRVELVPGNHDRRSRWEESDLGIVSLEAGARLGPITLWHEPPMDWDGFALTGHVHPVVRWGGTRLRVLWVRERCAVLPAYGLFTGGGVVSPKPGDQVYAVTGTKVHGIGSGPSGQWPPDGRAKSRARQRPPRD